MSTSRPRSAAKIAAALRNSPIYVDDRLARELPAKNRKRLETELAKAPRPVFLLVVPIRKTEGEWGDGEQLANSVHARLDAAGTYVTLDADFENHLQAYPFGLGETQESQAKDAAWAANLERGLWDATLADRLERCVQLLVTGQGSAAYRKARAEPGSDRTGGSTGAEQGEERDGFPVLPTTVAGTAVLLAVGGLVWLRRRGDEAPRVGLVPREVFRTARKASLTRLRETASAATVAFGEEVSEAGLDSPDPRVAANVQRALDAYQAAGMVLEKARDLPDYAGVLVLVDTGREALAAARAVAGRRRPDRPSPLCFFNPLHGDSARTAKWRPLGQRRGLKVPVCAECGSALASRRLPDTLPARSDGADIPYYEVSADRSVWAATGYGAFAGDLIERILRGEHRRAAG